MFFLIVSLQVFSFNHMNTLHQIQVCNNWTVQSAFGKHICIDACTKLNLHTALGRNTVRTTLRFINKCPDTAIFSLFFPLHCLFSIYIIFFIFIGKNWSNSNFSVFKKRRRMDTSSRGHVCFFLPIFHFHLKCSIQSHMVGV